MEHRFELDDGQLGKKIKTDCPACGAKKRFTRYIDLVEQDFIAPDIGICDRVNSCGYHKTPKDHSTNNPTTHHSPNIQQRIQNPTTKPVSFIDEEIVEASFQEFYKSTFFQCLIDLIGIEEANKIAIDYALGARGKRVIFWQIDRDVKIRTGKIMSYDSEMNRVGIPYFLHKEINQDFNLDQCLFGLHLTAYYENRDKPICIVESEKTAIIASAIMPDKVWLATGGVQNLKLASVIRKRVYLFPDKGEAQKWHDLATRFGLNFAINQHLEKVTEAKLGSDIADIMLSNFH